MRTVHRGTPALAEVDALVCPVTERLESFDSFGRAVQLEAGEGVRERLAAVGELPLGGAMITPGGTLLASYVIHAAVRTAEDPVSEDSVRKGLLNALRRAAQLEIPSLGLPLIGGGVGGLDPERAVSLMIEALETIAAEGYTPGRLVFLPADDFEAELLAPHLR